MSEEDKRILDAITLIVNARKTHKDDNLYSLQLNAYQLDMIQGLLDLYNKEKEKNKKLEEYANWHIEHLTEDIADYIDDDRKGNASIIGEFKEEREHWKDIIRIMNNEETYKDYKNY